MRQQQEQFKQQLHFQQQPRGNTPNLSQAKDTLVSVIRSLFVPSSVASQPYLVESFD